MSGVEDFIGGIVIFFFFIEMWLFVGVCLSLSVRDCWIVLVVLFFFRLDCIVVRLDNR